MSEENEMEYFTLIDGVQGTYEITSRDGEHTYNFKPNKVVEVRSYDAPKVRTYSYTKEVDETGMALPDNDPSKGPAEAVITEKDIHGGSVSADDEEKETPEEVPDPPEEEETIESDPSVIEVDEAEGIVETNDEVNLDEMQRPKLIKLATKLDYYKITEENPAQAKNDELKEFIEGKL